MDEISRHHQGCEDGDERRQFVTQIADSGFDTSHDYKFSFSPSSEPKKGTILSIMDRDRFLEWARTVGICFVRFCVNTFNGHIGRDIPTIVGNSKSSLISPLVMWSLQPFLPEESRRQWALLYSSQTHGQSLNQLMGQCSLKGPMLILIRESSGSIFGGYASAGLQKSPSYYGDATSFLFTVFPRLRVFPASGSNENFLYFNLGTQTLENGMGMGGQMKHMGWWIDADCHHGHSEPALTFKSPCLSSSRVYEVAMVEVWGCDLTQAVVVDPDNSRNAMAQEDKFLFDLVGRTGYSNDVRDSDGKPT
jgi:hypothetical protein